jgi:hypothetical protein
MSAHLIVGVDPGVKTGLALWDTERRNFVNVLTLDAIAAMVRCEQLVRPGLLKHIVMEDARLRTWFGTKGREVLMGAGSVRCDCSLWTEWADFYGVDLRSVSPQQKGAKVDAKRFAKLTGWTARTSQHSRDAGMLIFQGRA